MMIDTSSEIFRLADISEAIKSCNFNKGLGPDCFDGNILQSDQTQGDKDSSEIVDTLNKSDIPEYLRIGRILPLQKTATNAW